MQHHKYSRKLLEPLVEKNISVVGVMRDLGFKAVQGGSHTYLTHVIKKFGIDMSHFTGQASNRGPGHKGGAAKKMAHEVLVLRNEGRRQKSYQLRRALIESGRSYQCAACGIKGLWQNSTLMLEINHLNKNCLDDRKENLVFLCPNCHSQTDGHCGSKGNAEITSVAKLSREYLKRRKKRGSGGMADALRLERNG